MFLLQIMSPKMAKRGQHELSAQKARDRIKSLVNGGKKVLVLLRGPPGSGKTTLARWALSAYLYTMIRDCPVHTPTTLKSQMVTFPVHSGGTFIIMKPIFHSVSTETLFSPVKCSSLDLMFNAK